jgi:hypothetical protein
MAVWSCAQKSDTISPPIQIAGMVAALDGWDDICSLRVKALQAIAFA